MNPEQRSLEMYAVPPADEPDLSNEEVPKNVEQVDVKERANESYLYAASQQEIKTLEAVYGYIPEGHPVQNKVDEISKRLFGDDNPYTIKVTQGNSTVNAFALPDGHIVLHPGILGRVGSEDELAALIAHEGQHISAGHAARQLNQELGKRALDRVKSHAGLVRMNELEADLVSVVNFLEKSGFNPLAGASLFERLQQEESGWSVAHGSFEDRRLNILSLKYFLDIENVSQETTPFAADFTESVKGLTEVGEKPFNKDLKELQAAERQAVKELVENLKTTGDSRSLLLAVESLAEWRGKLDKLARVNAIRNTHDEARHTIRTSPKNTVVASREISDYQEASTELFEGLRNTKGFPHSMSSPELYAFVDIGLGIPLLENSKVADIKTVDGDFISLEVVDDANENGLQSIYRVLDPELWGVNGAGFLLRGSDLQWRLAEYVGGLDEAAAMFLNEDTGEFDSQKFLTELQTLTHRTTNFLEKVGYERFFDQKDFVSMIASAVAENNETTVKDILDSAVNIPGLEDMRQMLEPTITRERQQTDDFSPLLKDFNEASDKESNKQEVQDTVNQAEKNILDYIAANLDNFPTILRENTASMSPKEAIATYRNIMLILEDRLEVDEESPEAVAKLLNLYKDLIVDAGKSDLDSDLWRDICNTSIRGVDGLYETDRSKSEEALYELFKTVSDTHYDGNGQWIKDLYEWPRLFDRLIETAHSSDSDKAWDALERWYQFTRFSGPITNSENINAETHIEESQSTIQKLWHAELQPERKILLADLFIDSDIRRRVKASAADELAQGVTYDELRDLLFIDKKIGVADSPELIDHLTENLAQSPAQITEIQRHILNSYQESRKEMGVLTGADLVLEKILEDPSDSLLALTETRANESELARILFEHWLGLIPKGSSLAERLDPFTLTYFDSPDEILNWMRDKPALYQDLEEYRGQIYHRVDDLLERLYRSNLVERHGIVRKLLTNPKEGVLNTQRTTLEVAHKLVDNHVSLKPERVETVNQVMESLASAADKDELYFLLSPLFARAILQRPTERADYKSIVRESLYEDYRNQSENYEDELNRDLPVNLPGLETLGDAAVEKAYRWSFHGETATEEDAEKPINFAELEVLKSLPENYREGVVFKKMEESEALIEVATTLGAPGVRFLQLLGQYVHVDPDVERQFSAVYDSIKGQSKLSAFRTIQRERSDLLTDDATLSGRIGGGSLLTVYRHDRPDTGNPSVVKVLNPNAEQRVKESMQLAQRTAERLIRKSPDNLHYKMIREHLLADLEEWLLSDINDERFVENDKQFRANWNGFRVEGSDYEIQVPQMDEESNKFIKVEEFIEGKNLTQFSVGEETNYEQGILSQQEMREVVRLITSNYLYQIVSGVVHSDVHPGNFRITEDKKVAILDRNFYLELTDDDRQLFGSLTSEGAGSALASYLLRQPENQGTQMSEQELVSAISDEMSSVSLAENPEGVFGVVTKIKEAGLKIPLRITLLLKNLNGLNNFAKNAGYNNLLEVLS